MDWMILILSSLAACQLTESFRHGSIFASLRARIESFNDFFNELINCGFCFSHWAAGVSVLCVIGHFYCLSNFQFYHNPFWLFLFWLSCIRLANLLNDGTKFFNRTPPRDTLKLPENIDWESE